MMTPKDPQEIVKPQLIASGINKRTKGGSAMLFLKLM